MVDLFEGSLPPGRSVITADYNGVISCPGYVLGPNDECVQIKIRITSSPGSPKFTSTVEKTINARVRNGDYFEDATGFFAVFLEGGQDDVNAPTPPTPAVPDAPFAAPVYRGDAPQEPLTGGEDDNFIDFGPVYAIAPDAKKDNVVGTEIEAGMLRILAVVGLTQDYTYTFQDGPASNIATTDMANPIPNPEYKNLNVKANIKFFPANYNAMARIALEKAFELIDPTNPTRYLNNEISRTVGFRVEKGSWKSGMPVPAFEDEIDDNDFADYDYGSEEETEAPTETIVQTPVAAPVVVVEDDDDDGFVVDVNDLEVMFLAAPVEPPTAPTDAPTTDDAPVVVEEDATKAPRKLVRNNNKKKRRRSVII